MFWVIIRAHSWYINVKGTCYISLNTCNVLKTFIFATHDWANNLLLHKMELLYIIHVIFGNCYFLFLFSNTFPLIVLKIRCFCFSSIVILLYIYSIDIMNMSGNAWCYLKKKSLYILFRNKMTILVSTRWNTIVNS